MIYNGLRMKASRFQSTQKKIDIVGFYAREWPNDYVVDQVAAKTIIGHAEGEFYVTVELTEGGGGTKGTIGVTEFPKEGFKPELGKGLFKPAGTQVLSDVHYMDEPGAARTVVMKNNMSPYINMRRFMQGLRLRGWTGVEAGSCRPSSTDCVAQFHRADGGKLSLTATREANLSTALVANIQ